ALTGGVRAPVLAAVDDEPVAIRVVRHDMTGAIGWLRAWRAQPAPAVAPVKWPTPEILALEDEQLVARRGVTGALPVVAGGQWRLLIRFQPRPGVNRVTKRARPGIRVCGFREPAQDVALPTVEQSPPARGIENHGAVSPRGERVRPRCHGEPSHRVERQPPGHFMSLTITVVFGEEHE